MSASGSVSKARNGLSRERLINLSDRLRVANLHKKELNFKLVVIGDFGVGERSPLVSHLLFKSVF